MTSIPPTRVSLSHVASKFSLILLVGGPLHVFSRPGFPFGLDALPARFSNTLFWTIYVQNTLTEDKLQSTPPLQSIKEHLSIFCVIHCLKILNIYQEWELDESTQFTIEKCFCFGECREFSLIPKKLNQVFNLYILAFNLSMRRLRLEDMMQFKMTVIIQDYNHDLLQHIYQCNFICLDLITINGLMVQDLSLLMVQVVSLLHGIVARAKPNLLGREAITTWTMRYVQYNGLSIEKASTAHIIM